MSQSWIAKVETGIGAECGGEKVDLVGVRGLEKPVHQLLIVDL
jgi:hypothetical protein